MGHRAALLVEAPELPGGARTFLGSVAWSGTKGEAVEARIDLPDAKLTAMVTFAANSDPSLPASHTIAVAFVTQPDSAASDIEQINVPQLRLEEQQSGVALAGLAVSVQHNTFLVGLSRGEAERGNVAQLNILPWIDIPLLLRERKIAKLTFEKGSDGARLLSELLGGSSAGHPPD